MAAVEIPIGLRYYKTLIVEKATTYRLDPVLVAAVCWQESNFNTDAFRNEPDFWNRYLKGNPKYRHLNPRRVSSSYGLMQVMYCRVLEDKVASNDAWEPELLFIPENGVDLGCAFLVELFQWANAIQVPSDSLASKETNLRTMTALAAYNGGRGGNDPSKNWPLRNGKYAREVLAKHALLLKEFA